MADSGKFIAVCKKEWEQVVADNDELPISNLGAIRMGLEALQKEDADDFARANQLWAAADKLLAQESEDDQGPAATGIIQVNDDFEVASIGGPCFYGGS